MRSNKPLKITSRTSSVTNVFVQAIVPADPPNPVDQARVLAILEIDKDSLVCAYCGDPAQHWDHLNPFVKNKRPTGFLHEAKNLVPACGPCNTSKSGHPWRSWIIGSAKRSPSTRGTKDLEARVSRLEMLETEFDLKPIDLGSFVDAELWSNYWCRLDEIEQLMFAAQREADRINEQIRVGMSGWD